MAQLALARLQRALKQLELARTSRELNYSAVPFVVAAEQLVKQALEKQEPPFVPNIISGK